MHDVRCDISLTSSFAHVFFFKSPNEQNLLEGQKMTGHAYQWLSQRRVKAFYSSIVSPTLRAGAQNMMQVGLFLPLFMLSRHQTASRHHQMISPIRGILL